MHKNKDQLYEIINDIKRGMDSIVVGKISNISESKNFTRKTASILPTYQLKL